MKTPIGPLAACCFAVTTACQTTPPTGSVPSSGKNVALLLVPIDNPGPLLGQEAPPELVSSGNPSNDAERQVWASCGYNAAAPRVAFLPLLIGYGVQYLLNAASNALTKAINQYSRGFSATATVPFYKLSGAEVQARWSCIRFTRYKVDDQGKRTAVVDLIAKLTPPREIDRALNPAVTGDLLQFKPLRFYYAAALADSQDKIYSIGISLSASAYWREGNRGRTESLVSGTLLSVTCDLSKGGATWWYGTKRDTSNGCTSKSTTPLNKGQKSTYKDYYLNSLVSALPPYSAIYGPSEPSGPGTVRIVVTATEVGTAPKILCAL